MAKTLGLHILADLYGVSPDLIDKVEDIRHLLESAVEAANLTKISSHYYQFNPHGATGMILLAESHISIHTWPEYGLATVDVYTCGDSFKAYKATDYIVSKLSPTRVDIQVYDRGIIEDDITNSDLLTTMIVETPFPYEGGHAKLRDAELSESSLQGIREIEQGNVKPYYTS